MHERIFSKRDLFSLIICVLLLFIFDFFDISTLSFETILILVTLILIFFQLILMVRQDEILDRTAKIQFTFEFKLKEGHLGLIAINKGKKGLNKFDWHIWAPSNFVGAQAVHNPSMGSVPPLLTPEIIDGKNYSHYSSYSIDHIYPTRSKLFAQFTNIIPMKGNFKIYTEIACDDGVFKDNFEITI